MKYLAAYALLVLGGNEHPTADDMGKLLKEVGVAVDKEHIATLIEKVAGSGKTLPQLIAEGSEKFAAAAPAGDAPVHVEGDLAVEKKESAAADAEADNEGLEEGMVGLFDDDEY